MNPSVNAERGDEKAERYNCCSQVNHCIDLTDRILVSQKLECGFDSISFTSAERSAYQIRLKARSISRTE